MIYVTGDTHGDIERFKRRELKKLTNKDYLIVCGDFGFLWNESEEEHEKLNFLKSLKYNVLFVDGTHENFDILESYPETEYMGGKARKIARNIYHLMRGEVYNIDGKFIFTFGGGVSSDLAQIMDTGTWFERELPTMEEMAYGVEKLKSVNCEVDYIISHETSATYKHKIWRNCTTNPVNDFFEQLVSEVRYEKWFFGNLHVDFAVDSNAFAVFEEIVPIDGVRKSRQF
ncbi:MAG: metallophosphoesterase [Eubacteriales bacterium]|nr:metallophosphoesterase [Eubacteriales bacterium]